MEFFTDDINQREGCTEIDGQFNGQSEKDAQMPVMLTEEDEHGLIEHMHITE